jgi:hypothetical protein
MHRATFAENITARRRKLRGDAAISSVSSMVVMAYFSVVSC